MYDDNEQQQFKPIIKNGIPNSNRINTMYGRWELETH